MGVVVFDDEIISQYINYCIPKDILKLNPVIAGGFGVSLYLFVLASKISKNKFMNNLSSDGSRFYLKNFYRASDIDVWFLSDNKHPGADLLTKNYWSKSKVEQFSIQQDIYLDCVQDSKTAARISATMDNERSFFDISKQVSSLNYLCKRSDYANTFVFKFNCISQNRENKFSTIQFIRNRVDSVQSLLEDFDIDICKVAYFDGKMYCDESFIKSFEGRAVNVSEYVERKNFTLLNSLITSLRLIKYVERLNASLVHDYFVDNDELLGSSIKHLGNELFRLSTNSINFILNALFDFTNNEDYADILKNISVQSSIYSALQNQTDIYPEESSGMRISEYKKLEKGCGINLLNKLPDFILTNSANIDKKDMLKFSWIKYNRLQNVISSSLEKK